MIDQIWIQPAVHLWVGAAVLVTTLLSILIAVIYAVQNKSPNRLLYGVFLLAQLSIMLQVLIGIKLLDQGLGPLQLYIHYIGGLGAFLFYLLFYWFPESLRQKRWTAFSMSSLSFLFAFMAFWIGSIYVAE